MLKKTLMLGLILGIAFNTSLIASSALSYDELSDESSNKPAFEQKFFELLNYKNDDATSMMRVSVSPLEDIEEMRKSHHVGLKSVEETEEEDKIISKWVYYNTMPSYTRRSAVIIIEKIHPADD